MMRWLERFRRSAPVLRAARLDDASAMSKLHTASFRRGWSESEIEILLLDQNVVADCAEIGRRHAGFALSRRAADEAEILSIAVALSQQGRGLATRLLDQHLRRLAGFGTRAVFLEVDAANAPALKLYSRAGFVRVGERRNYYERRDGQTSAAAVLRRDL
jgi:[ribosomal protein S18]-alanine N-acetyltransferase